MSSEVLLTIPCVGIVVFVTLELFCAFFPSSCLGILLASEFNLLELIVDSVAAGCFFPIPIFASEL